MKNCLRVFTLLSFLGVISLFRSTPVFAAAPDGLGPWADTVVSSTQANTKGGQPVNVVNPLRSDPTSALGIAENDTVDGHFYSLGFGGSITLGFDNGISNGVIIVEATNPGYPTETASVEVSENGITWVNAGSVSADGQVNKPQSITCAKYVRITDTSNPVDFSEASADAYDVDGVKAEGESCTPVTVTPTPTCTTNDCGCSSVTQNNTTNVTVSSVAVAKTGGNKANKNNGGNTTITTGPATSSIGITVGGNSNQATVGNCCGTSGVTNITISGNGPGSKNVVKVNSGKKK